MIQLAQFDSLERQREKQRSRDQDDRDLHAGNLSADELAARNGFFSGLQLSGARIRHRGRIGA